jgi:hypothetical protein
MKQLFYFTIVCLMVLVISCLPQTKQASTESNTMKPATPPAEESVNPQSACNFTVQLPDTMTIMSSTVTERDASYQLVQPDRNVLGEVRAQLQNQGWTKLDTTKGITRYSCADSSVLQVSLEPVGKSLIYILKLELE